jgi:hypothetical protein
MWASHQSDHYEPQTHLSFWVIITGVLVATYIALAM